jgi:hypothetical protein
VHLLALALLCWVAGACLTIGYVANVSRSTAAALDLLEEDVQSHRFDLNALADRLNKTERVALRGSVVADRAEGIAKKARDDLQGHLDWVEEVRAANEKAARRARRGR